MITGNEAPNLSKPLQYGFASTYGDAAFDGATRKQKAAKVLAILGDCLGGALGDLRLLDVGCSAGFMSAEYARRFKQVVATDIDAPALSFAHINHDSENLHWCLMDSQRMAFPDEAFDVVTCSHIYEHVPNAHALMREIHRVLKPGGVCFFSAGNRLSFMEPHYRLPLLSVVPKPVAHLYLRILGRGKRYYETHLTYWGLRSLVSQFAVHDYTLKVIEDPRRYKATEVMRPGSVIQRVSRLILSRAYWICPTYLWVLRKHSSSEFHA
jgi:2-polyprenyl-3-methyl-5-hydroxy-6-metoxy-1,4-benzoquinol methylase